MRPQAFGLGEANNGRREFPQAFARKFLHGNQFYEIHHAQAATKARRARRRQNVVWSGGIIAGGLRRIVSDEN